MRKLSLNPQNVINGIWYYEEQSGIDIICELPERPGHPLYIRIPWRKLVASINRYKSVKAKRSTSK